MPRRNTLSLGSIRQQLSGGRGVDDLHGGVPVGVEVRAADQVPVFAVEERDAARLPQILRDLILIPF